MKQLIYVPDIEEKIEIIAKKFIDRINEKILPNTILTKHLSVYTDSTFPEGRIGVYGWLEYNEEMIATAVSFSLNDFPNINEVFLLGLLINKIHQLNLKQRLEQNNACKNIR